jgi:hypothetical protein
MNSTYLSTAACRDHALRVREAAPRALSGARFALPTAGIQVAVATMPPAVNVPFTTVDPQQDRPPRGVPR